MEPVRQKWADAEEELKSAAVEYGRAFKETDPKKDSVRREEAHKQLVQAARRYEALLPGSVK